MLKLIIGLFIVLHGLVYLVYVGQSLRLFELRPGMVWPDGSWAFSKLLGSQATRWLAGICYVLAAAGFVVGGLGIVLGLAWWRPIVVASALFSSLIIILFWNGKLKKLSDQGLYGILINAAILVAVLVFRWPGSGF